MAQSGARDSLEHKRASKEELDESLNQCGALGHAITKWFPFQSKEVILNNVAGYTVPAHITAPPRDRELPVGWSMHFDDLGMPFFADHNGVASWTLPAMHGPDGSAQMWRWRWERDRHYCQRCYVRMDTPDAQWAPPQVGDGAILPQGWDAIWSVARDRHYYWYRAASMTSWEFPSANEVPRVKQSQLSPPRTLEREHAGPHPVSQASTSWPFLRPPPMSVAETLSSEELMALPKAFYMTGGNGPFKCSGCHQKTTKEEGEMWCHLSSAPECLLKQCAPVQRLCRVWADTGYWHPQLAVSLGYKAF